MPARIKMQNILTRSQLSNQKSGSARHARAIKTTMLGLLCLLGMSTTERSYAAEANANTVVREYKQELEQARFAELMAHYGQHKELPPGYELQALGSFHPSIKVCFAIAFMATIPTIVATTMWNVSVGVVGANRASIFLSLLPLFGIGLAVSFLGEALLNYHFVGAFLICAGIVAVVWPQDSL